MSENQNIEWKETWRDEYLRLRFPFSAAYQHHVRPTRDATPKTTPKTTPERILALLKAEPEITQRRLAERIGLTRDGVKYHLGKLRAAGVIRRVGSARAGRWEVLT